MLSQPSFLAKGVYRWIAMAFMLMLQARMLFESFSSRSPFTATMLFHAGKAFTLQKLKDVITRPPSCWKLPALGVS